MHIKKESIKSLRPFVIPVLQQEFVPTALLLRAATAIQVLAGSYEDLTWNEATQEMPGYWRACVTMATGTVYFMLLFLLLRTCMAITGTETQKLCKKGIGLEYSSTCQRAEENDLHNWNSKSNQEEFDYNACVQLDSLTCDTNIELCETSVESLQDHDFGFIIRTEAKDILVEHLMNKFGTTLYIELPHPVIYGSLNLMLPFMQPEAVVALQPDVLGLNHDEHVVNGIYQTYKSSSNASVLLQKVRRDHAGPAIFSFSEETIHSDKYEDHLHAILAHTTDEDLVLISAQDEVPLITLQKTMCKFHHNWVLYRKTPKHIIMKAESLTNAPELVLPPIPDLVMASKSPVCSTSNATTDIIVLTRNRPMQTFAFLDSLALHASNVNKVWLLTRADDSSFQKGYDFTVKCFQEVFKIETVSDEPRKFGLKILEILHKVSSSSVMLAVDEIIWLRPFDLGYISCLLHTDKSVASYQLRLGTNLVQYPRIANRGTRFLPLAHNDNVYAFFPRRIAFDFGYVLHVDGIVMRTDDILSDLRDILPRSLVPGNLETMWIRNHLHNRSKQWHLMPSYSCMVNNDALPGGRVANSVKPNKDSHHPVDTLLVQGMKIDVKKFAQDYLDHKNTHTRYPFKFTNVQCPGN